MRFVVKGKGEITDKLIGAKVTKDVFDKLTNISNNKKITISEVIRQMVNYCLNNS